ncbi:major facilitator superfamily domain-containing protein [Yarrowia lipolytica]|uniref:Major facilitator superfamily domain-containing protein n=1 Tax=Yarrowia lipolytica TaxID=4952 RepID=A0A371CD13_YARLL|nr:major facilitator superfamily domain-containing protein [Yarrowia lipolytica]RDW37016.1 major facilitator superfamily domain-containing protein [Yarrowia lipolytica]RDW46525.1 major facilitator superfamily domain-containing protein [Yarrowia lipolytica]RDW52977.1 major facilitator superfamily domain-containing protein [Yarrowia lipolytica]
MRWYAEVSTFSRQTTLADSLHHQGREQITAHIVLAVFSAPFVLERDMIAGQKPTMNLEELDKKAKYVFDTKDRVAEKFFESLPPKTRGLMKFLFSPDHDYDSAIEHFDDTSSTDDIQLTHAEIVRRVWSKKQLIFGWICMLIMSLVSTIQASAFPSYIVYASSEFSQMGALASVQIVQACIFLVSRALSGKLADNFGRFEAMIISVICLTIGNGLYMGSHNIVTYFAALAFYSIGDIGTQMLYEIFAADTCDLKDRTFFQTITLFANLFTPWVAGPLVASVLKTSTWQWGMGMWAIITPCCAIPFLSTLLYFRIKAYRMGLRIRRGDPNRTWFQNTITGIIRMDLPGLVFLCAGLILFFVPISFCVGTDDWKMPQNIAMITCGTFFLYVAFPLWEFFGTKHPFLKFSLMKKRLVTVPGLIILLYYMAYATYHPYFQVWLLLAKGLPQARATNLNMAMFVALTGTTLVFSPLMRWRAKLKSVIVWGTILYFIGMGLTYEFRKPEKPLNTMILAQIFEGVGAGLLVIPIMVYIQVVCKQSDTAAAITIYYFFNSCGTILGNVISAAVYRNHFPNVLRKTGLFAEPEVKAIFGSIYVGLSYKVGTPQRAAIGATLNSVIRSLLIGPLIFCAIMFCLAITNADINLNTAQRMKEESEHVKGDDSQSSDQGVVIETAYEEKSPIYDEKKLMSGQINVSLCPINLQTSNSESDQDTGPTPGGAVVRMRLGITAQHINRLVLVLRDMDIDSPIDASIRYLVGMYLYILVAGQEIRQKVGWLLSDDLSVDNGGDELSSLSVA